jgi:hypothetical protein
MTTFYDAGDGTVMRVEPQIGFISDGNSTSTILTGDAVFTGSADDVSQFSTITVMIDTDQDSAASGFSMQFSVDGTNWDRAKTVTLVAAENNNQIHGLSVVSKFFRVVYTNGSVDQTHIRLQTIFHTSKTRDLSSGTEQAVQKWDDVSLVRSINDIKSDRNFGRIAYESLFSFSGQKSSVTTTANVISEKVTVAFDWPDTAETVQIATGGNVNDATAGSGALTVVVNGLDETWSEVSETLTCAGATVSAASVATFYRINSAEVESVGAYGGVNAGDIEIKNTVAGETLSFIPAGLSKSKDAKYTVPVNKTGYLARTVISVSEGNTAEIRLWERPSADDITTPFSPAKMIDKVPEFGVTNEFKPEKHPKLLAKTDFWLDAKKVTGGGVASVSSNIDIILVDD